METKQQTANTKKKQNLKKLLYNIVVRTFYFLSRQMDRVMQIMKVRRTTKPATLRWSQPTNKH